MSILKNPFAIKDNRTIMISDLSPAERGTKCGCICPNCSVAFSARMGEINVHHFAHTGESCDEIKSYLLGIYSLLEQCMLDEKRFTLPLLSICFHIPEERVITEKNITAYVSIAHKGAYGNLKKISPKKEMTFENVKVCEDEKGDIIALLVQIKDKQLAIKIIPPRTVCKISKVTGYTNLPTVAIDLSQEGLNLNAFTTERFKQMVIDKFDKKYWVSNPILESESHIWKRNAIVSKVFMKIIDESKNAHKAYLKRQEQLEIQRKQQLELMSSMQNEYVNNGTRPLQLSKKEEYNQGYQEIIDKFNAPTDHQIIDSFGNRWLKCNHCFEVKQDFEMSIYGGTNHVNSGSCSECTRKKNYIKNE